MVEAEIDPAHEDQSWAKYMEEHRTTDWDAKIRENEAKLVQLEKLIANPTDDQELALLRAQRDSILGDIESQKELKRVAEEDTAKFKKMDESLSGPDHEPTL